jgi:hypothetical protein
MAISYVECGNSLLRNQDFETGIVRRDRMAKKRKEFESWASPVQMSERTATIRSSRSSQPRRGSNQTNGRNSNRIDIPFRSDQSNSACSKNQRCSDCEPAVEGLRALASRSWSFANCQDHNFARPRWTDMSTRACREPQAKGIGSPWCNYCSNLGPGQVGR